MSVCERVHVYKYIYILTSEPVLALEVSGRVESSMGVFTVVGHR